MADNFDLNAFRAAISPSSGGGNFQNAFSPYQAPTGLVDAPEPKPPGDFSSGFQTAIGQTPALIKGAIGLSAATLENLFGSGGMATGVKNWALDGYQRDMAEVAKLQQENHDVTVAWKKAKEDGDWGAMVDFVQYAAGYGLAQIGESALAMLVGSVVGGALGGAAAPATAAAGAAAGAVKKGAVKSWVEGWLTNAVAKRVAESGGTLTTKQAIKQMTAKWGGTQALMGWATVQETGAIYPEAVEQIEGVEGREMTGYDIARVWGFGIAAGLLEGGADKLQLDAILGRNKYLKAAFGKLGVASRTAIGGGLGLIVEPGTELGQTYLEQLGAQKDPFSDAAKHEYINAMAMAAVPGLGAGMAGGAMSRQRLNVAPTHGGGGRPPDERSPGEIYAEIGRAGSVDEAIMTAGALAETGMPMTEGQLLSDRAQMARTAEEMQGFLRERDWNAIQAPQGAQTGAEASVAFDARERRLGAVEEAQRGIGQEQMLDARGEQQVEQELLAANAAGMNEPAPQTAMGLAMERELGRLSTRLMDGDPAQLRTTQLEMLASKATDAAVRQRAIEVVSARRNVDTATLAEAQSTEANRSALEQTTAPTDMPSSRQRELAAGQPMQAPTVTGAVAPGPENDAAAVQRVNAALAAESRQAGRPASPDWQIVDVATLPVDDTPLPGSPVDAMTRSQESVRLAQAVAGLLGKRVIPIRNLNALPGDFMGGTVISDDGERIYLNVDSPDASPIVTTGHEAFHLMEVNDPDLAVGIRRAIGLEGKQEITAEHPLVGFYRYYNSGAGLTDEQVVAELAKPAILESMKREISADFFGNRAGEYKTLQTIFKAVAGSEDKGLIYKVADYIVKFIDSILRRLKTQKFEVSDALVAKLVKDLEGAKQAARDAMAEYAKRQGLTKMQAEAAMREALVSKAAQPKPRLDKNQIPILSKQRTEWKKGPMGLGATVNGERVLVRRVVMGDGSYQYQALVAGAAVGTAKTEAAAQALAEQRLDELSKSRQRSDAGSFQYTTLKDGRIDVVGDPAAIRELLPPGILGRATAAGLRFSANAAHRVVSALKGDRLTYGREGLVSERHPVKNGVYVGAPERFNTPAKLPHLRKILRSLAEEGAPGRFWYERSSEAVLKFVGGDVQEARKFVALLAIYSPQAKVDANSTFALRAWAQYKAGQPISVKTRVTDRKAQSALDNVDAFWSGEKTGNFFFNLLSEIDPATKGKHGATIDMWMMRAGQYDTDAPNTSQYRFMEVETNRLAKELGWEPQQVQAAIWVSMKARMENSGVKKRTEAKSVKAGHMRYVQREKNGRSTRVREVLNEQKHRNLWLKEAFALDVSAEDTAAAKFDFADGVRRHVGQVSWEARPSTSVDLLPGVHTAPYEQQLEFQQAMVKALHDENGVDMLAQMLGLLTDGLVITPGVWEATVSPSTQVGVAMPPDAGATAGPIDPAVAKRLDVYAAILGLLLKQDGVGWHRPFYASTKKNANGIDIDVGRQLTGEETSALYAAIDSAIGKPGWNDALAIITTPAGVRLVNFGAVDNAFLHKELTAAAETVLPNGITRTFASSGNMPTNKWKEFPDGQAYRQRARAEGRSDVLDWATSVLAPRVDAVVKEFGERYGWSAPRLAKSAVRSGSGGNERAGSWSKRAPQPAAVEVDAWHYGQERVPALSGRMYGRGIKGEEAKRLAIATDPRIKRRVYFYIGRDTGQAPNKEGGLGPHKYVATLGNMFDPRVGDSRIVAPVDPNLWESSILDAGYDGYVNRSKGMAVVLDADVPATYVGVDYAGPALAAPAPAAPTLRKQPLMSAEIGPVTAAIAGIPGARVRMGTLEVAQASVQQVNAALSNAGIGVQLSRPRRTDTPAFKKWFGDSKVVDGKGAPLVVYHGTKADLTEFSSQTSRGDGMQAGVYFATDAGHAAAYAGKSGAVYPVHLSIKNPLDLTTSQNLDGWAGRLVRVLAPRIHAQFQQENALKSATAQSLVTAAERDRLMAAGYDGVKGEGGVWIAFRPEQIKSIYNEGTFDPANPNISKSAQRDAAERFNTEQVEKNRVPNWKGREKLVQMPLDQFIALSEDGRDETKAKRVARIMERGEQFETLPYLIVEDDGRVTGHEGRHRARWLLENGYATMPVVLKSANIRWSEQADPSRFDYIEDKDWPQTLRAQKGAPDARYTAPFPVTREDAMQPYPSEPSEPSITLSKERVQAVIDGTDKRPRIGLSRQTPPAFLAAGFNERPLTISRTVIEKLASGAAGQRLGLSAAQIAELPAAMWDPIAIYDFERGGRDSVNVLFMRGEDLWLAGVARDLDAGAYVVNELLTAFAPNATPERVAGLNRDMVGRIRYVDRKRVFALPARIRDYSPALTQAARNPGNSIATPARISKSTARTDTPAFQRWFGESVVREKGRMAGEDGPPAMMFHSTIYDFSEFNEFDTLGQHFGTDRAAEERLNDLGTRREVKDRMPGSRTPLGANVMPVYLRIEKPLRIKDAGNWMDSVSVAVQLRDEKALSKHARQQVADILTDVEESQTQFENSELPDEYFTDTDGNPIPPPDWASPWTASAENANALHEIRSILELDGFDGIVYTNQVEHAGTDSYIAFRSEQVKSAIGNSGQYADVADITKSAQRWGGFYSELAKQVEALPTKSSVATGWKQAIKSLTQKGVKVDEIEWSGVNEWLDLQDGKVSKEALLDYLAQNGPTIEETVKSDGSGAAARLQWEEFVPSRMSDPMPRVAEWPEMVPTRLFETEIESGTLARYEWDSVEIEENSALFAAHVAIEHYPNDPEFSPIVVYSGRPEGMLNGIDYFIGRKPETRTRFGKYTVTGGSEYRELLIRLPSKTDRDGLPAGYKLIDEGDGRWSYKAPARISKSRIFNSREDALSSALRAVKLDRAGGQRIGGEFSYPNHWEEKNVVAHVRFKERADAGGARVLFIEEGQSDWAQQGGEEGFFNPAMKEKREAQYERMRDAEQRVEEIEEAYSATRNEEKRVELELAFTEAKAEEAAARREWDEFSGSVGSISPAPFVAKREFAVFKDDVEVKAAKDGRTQRYGTMEEAQAAAKRLDGEARDLGYGENTPAWVSLMFKRMIGWAVENGFDKIAWATGVQSAEHYKLEKHVSSLMWLESENQLFGYDPKTDQMTISEYEVTREKLPKYIGKELAERLVEQKKNDLGMRTLEGDDLVVGGEGMKTFYESVLPNIANEVLRKLKAEAKVGVIEVKPDIPVAGMSVVEQELGARETFFFILNDRTGEVLDNFDTRPKAEAELKRRQRGMSAKFVGPQLGFEITPQLKAAAERGLPLFSKQRWFEGSKAVDANGEPLVLYHSTSSDVDAFKVNFGEDEYRRFGVHVGSAEAAESRIGIKAAEDVANNERSGDAGMNVMPVYLRAKNPLRLDENRTGRWGVDDILRAVMEKAEAGTLPEIPADSKIVDDYYDDTSRLGGKVWQDVNDWRPGERSDALRKWLESLGYDSIVYANEFEGGGDSYIAFRPEQIKSAIGNEGTFDPTDARLTKSADRSQYLGALTPAQEAALRTAGGIVQPKTWQERWTAYKTGLGQRAIQGIFDQFDPIKHISQEAYMQARMSRGSDGTLEATLLFGRPKLVDGVPNVDINDRGFAKVLADLGVDTDRFFWWVAAKRAQRLKAEGRENLLTDQDVSALLTLNEPVASDAATTDRPARFSRALAELNEFNEAILRIALESDLIDKDGYNLFKDQPYVPFFRVMEDEGGIRGPGFGSGLTSQYMSKKLKGGSEALNQDLLANVLINWSHVLSASAKNRAAVATMGAAMQVGAVLQVPSAVPKSVRIRVEGKEQHFLVHDPHLLEAISAIEYATPRWFKPFSTVKRWLTIGVTASPTFKIRNLIRDSVQAIATGQLGPNPLANVAQGFKASSKETQTFASMLASGGMIRFGSLIEGDRAHHAQRLIDKAGRAAHILDQNGWKKLQGQMVTLIEAYNELGDLAENVNRSALYEQLRAKGVNHLEAAFMARDLMDFAMGGTWPVVRFLTQSVPFLNARMQGLYKLGRSAKGDPMRVGYVVSAVSLASLALLLMYGDDEDWKKREDWDRDTYWWFKIGDTAFRIPKPFEIGAIGTIAERTWELMFDEEMGGKRYGRRTLEIITEQFAMNPVPQIIKPMVDLYANRDSFTGREIEGVGMQRRRPEDRARASTSTVALALGQLGLPNPAQLASARYEALSPVQIDHLVRGYFGWLGTAITSGLDYGLRPLSDRGVRPEMRLKDVFVAGNFVETLPANSSRYVTEMYEQSRQAQQFWASYRDATKSGDTARAAELMAENREQLLKARRLSSFTSATSQITEQVRRIEASRNLTPETKRNMINALEQRRNQLAMRAVGAP